MVNCIATVNATAKILNLLKSVLNRTISIAIMDKAACRLGKQLSCSGSTIYNASLKAGSRSYNKGATLGRE
jgi:hypothetical protein